jgi:hypothetical protein
MIDSREQSFVTGQFPFRREAGRLARSSPAEGSFEQLPAEGLANENV